MNSLNNDDIQKKCMDFLQSLGVSGFIVFGWQKDNKQFGFVYSQHKMPPNVAVKGMTWALNDFASKHLK